jgi:hypothetical protein
MDRVLEAAKFIMVFSESDEEIEWYVNNITDKHGRRLGDYQKDKKDKKEETKE